MKTYANDRIEVLQADITTLSVDAIVNAANSSLLGGGGVDGAIHRAAGPELVAECRTLGGAETGEAKLTLGYNLPAGYIIHAVGPVWNGGTHDEDALLARCYDNAMAIAVTEELSSVAFPAISTGIFAFPLERATRIAITTVRGILARNDKAPRVSFCCFSAGDAEVYHRLADELL